MELGLGGAKALVTGSTRGIGLAIAKTLAGEGCSVAVCGRDPDQLALTATELKESGTEVFAAALDVTQPDALTNFVDDAANALHGLDLVVANAGGALGGALSDSTGQDWMDSYSLNVAHSVNLLRAARQYLAAAKNPAAVMISSISGSKPAPRAQYGASKAALIYLAGALAHELAEDGIRVNTVSPGSILFPNGGWDQYRTRDPQGFQSFLDRDLPAGRLGTADEVAVVVAFLLSPLAKWINGANIPVDGAQGRPSAGGW